MSDASWSVYLSGEIHSDWRERIQSGAENAAVEGKADQKKDAGVVKARGKDGEPLTEEENRELRELERVDREVRRHLADERHATL